MHARYRVSTAGKLLRGKWCLTFTPRNDDFLRTTRGPKGTEEEGTVLET
jgi:hypothetical protein